jgi:hypothetical protein
VNTVIKIQNPGVNIHVRPQYFQLPNIQHARLKLDFLGKFENLHSDWQKLQEEFNLEDLPHLEKTNHLPYQEYYKGREDLVEKVAKFYKMDLTNFGYSWDG